MRDIEDGKAVVMLWVWVSVANVDDVALRLTPQPAHEISGRETRGDEGGGGGACIFFLRSHVHHWQALLESPVCCIKQRFGYKIRGKVHGASQHRARRARAG